MENCIYCGGKLFQNPIVPHWKHCEVCDPERVSAILEARRPSVKPTLLDKGIPDKRGRKEYW